MEKLYTNDGIYISKALLEKLNEWDEKPKGVTIRLEELDLKPPAMSIQPLQRAEVIRKYVNGTYIGCYTFAVYMRVLADDTAARLDAARCLEKLADWLQKKDGTGAYKNMPEIDNNHIATSIELEATPAISNRYENGIEDYQSIFTLRYLRR